MSYQAIEENCNTDLWILDSGCSNHMTGYKSLLSNLDSFVVTDINLGDEFLVPVKGKGIVLVLTMHSENKFIHDVLFVPHLNVNLISIGQLLQN